MGEPGPSLPARGHVRCLLTPLIALAYFSLQPTSWPVLLAFLLAPFALDWNEGRSPRETRQPAAATSWVDLLLYALVALHAINLFLALALASRVGLASPQTAVALVLVVLSSSLAGAVTGHELIHRRPRHQRWLGRLLLATFFYEHFYTEHLRGHHVRAGTAADPTTARAGESFRGFLRRTLPGQLASAWRLDARAVGVGLALEVCLVAAVATAMGGAAVALFVVHAVAVTVLFQAVSYIEHWGLTREPGGRAFSWDTDNRSTLFSMVGPARHADHHAHPARPFHQLRYVESSPKLPHGYAGMISLAMFRNRRFRRIMAEELRRFRDA